MPREAQPGLPRPPSPAAAALPGLGHGSIPLFCRVMCRNAFPAGIYQPRLYPLRPIPAIPSWNCFDKLVITVGFYKFCALTGLCCRKGLFFCESSASGSPSSFRAALLTSLPFGPSGIWEQCPGRSLAAAPGTRVRLDRGVGTASSCRPFPHICCPPLQGGRTGVWENVRIRWLLPWESSREQLVPAPGAGPGWGGGLGAS